jgi:hypothetical protein
MKRKFEHYENDIYELRKLHLNIENFTCKHGETGIKHCENDLYI